MSIQYTLRKKCKKALAFSLSMVLLGINVFSSVSSGITAFAAEIEDYDGPNHGQQQGLTPDKNPDGTTPNGNKPQDIYDTARVYVNNTPIRLEVSKVKTQVGDHEGIAPNATDATQEDTITYKLSGRVDGSAAYLVQTYGSENIQLAYSNSGVYLGYGWTRGTLEYLKYRKEHCDEFDDVYVDIIYNEYGVFSGYAYVTKKLETADDANRYVAGATMTLYDAIEIYRMPDLTQDDRFAGVVVTRNANNDVVGVYVRKGYAGTKVEYVKEETDEDKISTDADTNYGRHFADEEVDLGPESKPVYDNLDNGVVIDDNYTYQDEINEKGEGTWIAKTIQREDTPILYYNLNDLHITTNDIYYSDTAENQKAIDDYFGNERYNKSTKLYGLDREGNIVDVTQKDQLDFTLFAFQGEDTKPSFEIVAPDYTEVKYNSIGKYIEVGDNTVIYHLDEDGNRDAMVDPRTGIAYIEEDEKGPGMWFGGINLGADADTRIYVWPVNIYKDGTGSETFEKIKTNRIATINADTADEYTVGTYTGDDFEKEVDPTLDKHGMPEYYQRSDETYVKGSDIYDRDGDYLGYGYTDELDNDNLDAYRTNTHDDLYNGDEDDPFDQATHYQYSDKQRIEITVDLEGNYIVNGKDVVPTPERDGWVFSGWLVEPNELTNELSLNAYWVQRGSMPADQKNKWYSDRDVTDGHQTMTIVVEFNANGGQFIDGSGDIHSTDNPLYFRSGEAYLIENTWVTGENTPNDPFDNQKVNTIDQTSNTANDPYTGGNNDPNIGGTADMLKRVPAGTYIMEELIAPAGYVKGLPVGVAVTDSTDVQFAEMVDTTIKIQILKLDATESFEYDRYKNGNLELRPDGTHVTQTDYTGSFSYEEVKGATLALKATKENQTVFNNWVNATNHPSLTKVKDGDNMYVTFKSDSPLYIEGLPKGDYIISEIETPEGFVTAEDQKITVTETTDLITYVMNDDHTRLEIKKYYNDEYGQTILPNEYRATLQLLDKNRSIVAEWQTDDISDYKSTVTTSGGLFGSEVTSGFIENYQKSFTSENVSTRNIEWIVERTAEKKVSTDTTETWHVSDGSVVEIVHGEIPEDAPEGFADAYQHRNMDAEQDKFTYTIQMSATRQDTRDDLSHQVWLTNTGKKIVICVYSANGSTAEGRPQYIYEYKFNYKDDYSGIYENMVSYDDVDGLHHFDYIPVGTYVLHESKAPSGFVKADDKTMDVKEVSAFQYYDLENVRKELIVTKVAEDEAGQFFVRSSDGAVITGENGTVIPGASLSLIKGPKDDTGWESAVMQNPLPEGYVVVETWTSGNDGYYTITDNNEGKIPDGFKIGDLKPHKINDIEDGNYYIIETKTPNYYRTAEPLRIVVDENTTASNLTNVKIINKEMLGKLKIHKVNAEGSDLTGATFTIKNKETGEVVGNITVKDGFGEITIGNIGKFDAEGHLTPYTFTVQETSPAPGYALTDEIHEFTFDPNMHDEFTIAINPDDTAFKDGTLTVVNDETAITISKTDYESGDGVVGATLQVFEAQYSSSDGWSATTVTKDPEWKWTTAEGSFGHTMIGLEGDKSYVLKEISAPAGYNLAADMFFHVSKDGKRIDKIWYDKNENPFINFESDNTGAITSVDIQTKSIKSTRITLTDVETGETKDYNPTNDGLYLTASDVVNGKVYRMKEIVTYTNGDEYVIGTRTFVAKLEQNRMIVPTRTATFLHTKIYDHNGEEIASFESKGQLEKLSNRLVADAQRITVEGNGANHAAIDNSSTQTGRVVYSITVTEKDSVVVWKPDQQTEVLRTEPQAEVENGIYTWTTTEDNTEIRFVTNLKQGATGYTNQLVTINDKVYSYLNPIALNQGETSVMRTSKISLVNEVLGTDPNNETYSFTYRVTLTKGPEQGNAPLDGSYDYRTKNGRLGTFNAWAENTQFDVTLVGNDFLIIDGLPNQTHCTVQMIDPSEDGFVVQNTTSDITTSTSAISNILFTATRNTTVDRELFKKNSTYTVVEELLLSDDTVLDSAKYGFSISENCEVVGFDMKDKATNVQIQKVDANGDDLANSRLAIYEVVKDARGNKEKDPETGKLKKGTQVEQWVSDGTPHTLKATLEPGEEYILEELVPTDGYWRASEIPFMVSEDGTIDKIVMVNEKTLLKFKKTDFVDSEEVPGAHLQIKDKDGNIIDEWFSGENGEKEHIIEGELKAGETYYLHEEGAPDGYYYSKDIEFTVPEDLEDVVEGENDLVTMQDSETDVKITKIDKEKRTPVIGATLQITDLNGTVIDTWISEETPHDLTGVLNAKTTYVLSELHPADGYYKTSTSKEFTLPELPPNTSAGVIYVEMENTKTNIKFKKNDFATGDEVPGAHLQVKDKDGNIIDEWDSGEEDHVIEGELKAGETYYLHEEGAPDGYYYSEDVEFTVPENIEDVVEGKNDLVTMTDAATDVRVTKVNEKTGEPVVDATLQILDEAGNVVVDTWVSTGEPKQVYGKLNAETTYYLHEVAPPSGFYRSDDVAFTLPKLPPINESAGIIWVQMKDTETKIRFKKTDFVDGEEVPGANIELRDSNGTLVDSWTSTEEEHIIEGKLKAGETYHMHEEGAPDGYYYSKDVVFTIPEDLSDVVEGTTDLVVMQDKEIDVRITKSDVTNGEEIPGAHLQVLDKNGTVVEEWTSTTEPHIFGETLKAGETYTLREELPPDGYYYTEEVQFSIPKYPTESGIVEVEMKDAPTVGRFKKSDVTTGKELPGAHLQIKDKDGNIIDEWTSTTEDHIITGKLKAGETYYMHEEGAPDGYAYAEDIEFTVPNSSDEDIKVEMKDAPTHVKFKKKDVTNDEELPGAHIQIKDAAGNVVDEWTSTTDEHVLDGKLVVGQVYTMHEEGAPDGYGYSTDIEFYIDEDNNVWVHNQETGEWEKREDSLVEMFDDVLKLEVEKVEKGTTNSLTGATLRITDSNGKVVEEWITVEGEKHTMLKQFQDGTLMKVGDVYTLSEVKAPNGYMIAPSQTFTLNRYGNMVTIKMEDTRVDKPWTVPEIRLDTLTFDKYNGSSYSGDGNATITNQDKLAGAEYTIYRADGSVYTVVVTGDNGSVSIPMPPVGTYFFKETKAPAGYMRNMETYSFTVAGNDTVTGTLSMVDYKKPEIELEKRDSATKELLAGAEFRVIDSNGNIVFEGVTESDGKVVFTADYADTYKVVEVKAPEGYDLNTTYITFIVSETGTVSGTTVMYDTKTPHEEKPTPKIGSVSAKYSSDYYSDNFDTLFDTDIPFGFFGIDRFGNIVLPKSGDVFNLALVVFAWVASLGCIGYVIFRRKKRNNDTNK